jgi:cytochrome c oxidase cbb3-type subunit 1
MLAGVGFLLIAVVGQLLIAWPSTGRALGLSWFVYAHAQFNLIGFLTLVLLGAAFYIVPRVAGVDLSPPANLTFWLIAGGTTVAAGPLALAGLREAAQFGKLETPFMEIVKSTLMYLRLSTVGELSIVVGCAVFLVFVARVILALVRPAVRTAYSEVTRDLIEPTRVKS